MTTPDRDGRPGGLREAVEAALEQIERQSRTCKFDHTSTLRALLAEHPATPAEEDRECRYPCDCGQFPEEHCACMDGHDPEPAEVAVEEREATANWCHRWTCSYLSEGCDCPTDHLDYEMADAILASDFLRDHDAALTAKAKAEALREAAGEHEAQLVCCDVFERLRDKPSREWTDAEREEMRSHAICYWGAACAEGDRERADRMTP